MDPPASYTSTERKFIQQHPTSSTYSGRISKDDKAKLEPLIIRLHAAGASREKILAECNAILSVTISSAQLDGLRKRLGLHTYRKQLLGSLSRPTAAEDAAIFSPTVGVYDNEGTQENVPSFDLQSPQNDAKTTFFQNSFQLPGLRSAERFYPAKQHDTPQIENAMELTDSGYSEMDLECTTPQLSIAGNSTTTEASISTFDGSPELSPVYPHDKTINPSSLPSSKPAQSLELDRNAIMAQARFEIKFKATDQDLAMNWQREVVYRPSLPVVRFYLQSLAGGTEKPKIAQLLRVAALLHTLRAYDAAFDLFFILYQYFMEDQQSFSPPHPLLIFAGISCSRSAPGRLQFQVARNMVHHVRHLTRSVRSMHVRVVNYLTRLEQRLDGIVHGLYDHLPAEDSIDAALWTLAPLSLHPVEQHIRPWPRRWRTGVIVSSAVNDTLKCLQDGNQSPAAFLDGLKFVFARNHTYSRSLDSLALETRLTADLRNGDMISNQTQSVAYAILKEYSKRSAPAVANFYEAELLSADGLSRSLSTLAIAMLPFAMVDWIGQVGHMFDIGYAMEQLQQASNAGPLTIPHLVDLCFRQMSAPTTDWAPATCGVSADEMLAECGVIASGQRAIDEISQHHDQENTGPSIDVLNDSNSQRQLVQSASFLPTIAKSLRASNSSSLRSLLSVAARANHAVARLSGGRESTFSDARTSRSSWKFSFLSTTPSSRMSTRQSVQTISSDIEMTG